MCMCMWNRVHRAHDNNGKSWCSLELKKKRKKEKINMERIWSKLLWHDGRGKGGGKVMWKLKVYGMNRDAKLQCKNITKKVMN